MGIQEATKTTTVRLQWVFSPSCHDSGKVQVAPQSCRPAVATSVVQRQHTLIQTQSTCKAQSDAAAAITLPLGVSCGRSCSQLSFSRLLLPFGQPVGQTFGHTFGHAIGHTIGAFACQQQAGNCSFPSLPAVQNSAIHICYEQALHDYCWKRELQPWKDFRHPGALGLTCC